MLACQGQAVMFAPSNYACWLPIKPDSFCGWTVMSEMVRYPGCQASKNNRNLQQPLMVCFLSTGRCQTSINGWFHAMTWLQHYHCELVDFDWGFQILHTTFHFLLCPVTSLGTRSFRSLYAPNAAAEH